MEAHGSPIPLDQELGLELHPRKRVHPEVVSQALDLVARTGDISEEALVNAWDLLKRAAEDYEALVNSRVLRPVGRGVVGDVIESRLVFYCITHGWSAEETFCYYPKWYRRTFPVWKRWGKRRRAAQDCVIEPRLMFSPEVFE